MTPQPTPRHEIERINAEVAEIITAQHKKEAFDGIYSAVSLALRQDCVKQEEVRQYLIGLAIDLDF